MVELRNSKNDWNKNLLDDYTPGLQGFTHCMQIICLVNVASSQPSVVQLKGYWKTLDLSFILLFSVFDSSATEFVDCILALQVVAGSLLVFFLVSCKLRACPAHSIEKSCKHFDCCWNWVVGFPSGFLLRCLLLPVIFSLQVSYSPMAQQ